MDGEDNQAHVPGLSDEDRLNLGAQQVALIHLQQQQAMLEEEHQRQMLEAKLEQEKQLFLQAQVEQERTAELQHLQQMAMLERQADEQEMLMLQQQQQAGSGPSVVPSVPSLMSLTVTGPASSSHGPPGPMRGLQGPPFQSGVQFPGPPQRLQGPHGVVGQSGPNSGPQAGGPAPRLPQTSQGVPPLGGFQSTRNQSNESSSQPPSQDSKEKLPIALEKVLAYKDVRIHQVGIKPEELEQLEQGEFESDQYEPTDASRDDDDDIDHDEEIAPKSTVKKETKSKKKKKKKKGKNRPQLALEKAAATRKKELEMLENQIEKVEVEYIPEELEISRYDPSYYEFTRIFNAFKITEPVNAPDGSKPEEERKKFEDSLKRPEDVPIKARGTVDLDDEDKVAPVVDTTKLSKKKMKKLNRLSVAELKQLVTRPDVVEMHDITSRDPKLLVHLKATRNSVPVPRHWCFKRKYLQGKRGIEKPPFDLPEFIKATGIMEMRQALQEKEDQKTLKAKMRERVRPKMGKIDIDYQKLHDAFFKWQTKPKMSIHGDLYYEGKEFETRLKEKKPGNLSDDLRTALGMPIGVNAEKYPPPWLIAMQRYGPPPSYPSLKIPGLNAPIPEGCAFGYHAGGWGKPPVDELGKPLYGDVFGVPAQELAAPVVEEDIDKTRWGELESESEEEESSDEDEDEEEDGTGLVTPAETGLVTPSGVTSVPIGVETPDMIELRKRRIEDQMEGGDTPALPYAVLPEKKAGVGGAMMGSTHVYDMSMLAGKKAAERVTSDGIEVTLNPEELDLDTAAMQAKYEQTVREQQSQLEKEDLSDMVAEHAAKQQKKRKKQQQQQEGSKQAKKYKEFKF